MRQNRLSACPLGHRTGAACESQARLQAHTPPMKRLFSVALLWTAIGCALAAGASAQEIAGQATVVDGDTLTVGGQRVRLWGIDAPESHQACSRGGSRYQCGSEATLHLWTLVASGAVRCEVKTHDRYKRAVAVCRSQGRDVGAEMVRAGWALAFVRYSSEYVGAEAEARSARRGMWAGTFDAPWDWRAAGRQ